jgi:predicted AlkP superfamily phosphohydrolase/phosphomutase
MVASFITPDKLLNYTYPKEIASQLDEVADGNYIIDVENFRTNNKTKLLQQIYEMTEKRFKIIKKFVQKRDWDLFIAVEMGIDRLHHGFWSYSFKDHRLFKKGNEFENTVFEYYKFIDKKLAELLELFDKEIELMIVSDHGAKSLKGTFCINDWLLENGYLALKNEVSEKTSFNVDDVDWNKTKAWGSGGYYGKLYLNVLEREPKGVIPEDQVDSIKTELITKLSSIPGPEGDLISSKVYDVKKIYRRLEGYPPDLFILVGELDWRVTNSIGNDSLFLYENTRIDNANHDVNGIYIHSTDPRSALKTEENAQFDSGPLKQYSIIDIAPTVLDRFKIEIPEDLFGKIIN